MNNFTKRTICLVLCFCLSLGLFGCRAQPEIGTPSTEATETAAVTEPTQPASVAAAAPTDAPTEAETEPAQQLQLDTEEVTFAHKGEEAEIYSGPIDRELIDWTSDDISVALAYQGTVIAVGSGETTVHGEYGGQKVSCRVISNADPEEPKPLLTPAIWHAPQRKPPELDVDVSEYCKDVIIMGDSTSYALYLWNIQNKGLGEPLFLVRGGVSIFSLIDGLRKYLHGGEEKLAEDAIRDAVQEEGRSKLYIMLGANDVPQFGIEETIRLMDTFLNQILAKSPELEIYLQSITPVRTREQYDPWFTNETFDLYNESLKNYAQEKGYHYVEIATYFEDNENGLVQDYSIDKLHANDEGCRVWVQALKKYITEEMRGTEK